MSTRTEVSTPLLVNPDSYLNVTDLLLNRLADAPDHIAFEAVGRGGNWRSISTSQFATEVRELAKGIIAIGVQPGESLAIMAPTSYQWTVVDLAAMFAGAIVVPIYETSSVTQASSILVGAEVKVAITGGPEQFKILTAAYAEIGILDAPLWPMEGGLEALLKRGVDVSDQLLEKRRTTAKLDSVATIVYTSGTGGEPKGANITHRNLVGQVLNIGGAYTDVVRSDGNTVIFLPLAHVLARGLQLICLANGMRIAHLSNPREAVESLARLRPTFLVVVPKVLQKIRSEAEASAKAKHIGWLWAWAERTAIELGAAAENTFTAQLSLGLRIRSKLFDRLFYSRIRRLLGDHINYLLSGAAALDPDLARIFCGMGVQVIEGYGLTETTAPLTGNLPGNARAGTVGVPQPGNTVRISAAGEVLAKGIGVFAGYRDPTQNEDAFEQEFFRTGDLGFLDRQGRLTITGRTKDVIVTSGGKTISPQKWESQVELNPLVAHSVVVGEGRSHLRALILLDTVWAQQNGYGTFQANSNLLSPVTDKPILELIKESIEGANTNVSHPEQVRSFLVLVADLTPGTALMTPTLKLRREKLLGLAAPQIDELFRVRQ